MPFQNNQDNIYPINTFVVAKEAPMVKLQVKAYYQRIYYCAIVNDVLTKQKAYFERELTSSKE